VKVNYRLPDDRDLEQEIANVAVARDPKQALQIARESLRGANEIQTDPKLNFLVGNQFVLQWKIPKVSSGKSFRF